MTANAAPTKCLLQEDWDESVSALNDLMSQMQALEDHGVRACPKLMASKIQYILLHLETDLVRVRPEALEPEDEDYYDEEEDSE